MASASSPLPISSLGRTGQGRELFRLAVELPSGLSGVSEGDAFALPAEIHLIPTDSGIVNARDGRQFVITDLASVVADSALPLLLDYDHSSELGNDTTAAGWVTALSISDGSDGRAAGLWGTVSFSDEGAADVSGRSYRYISPVLMVDAETRAVQQVCSAALTNRPALTLSALSSFRESLSLRFGALSHEEQMSDTEIGAMLVAEREAFATQAKELTSLKELCSELQSQLQLVTAERTELATKLEDFAKHQFEADVLRVLEGAAKLGQVTPATHPKWQAFCSASAANFETFKTLVLPSLPKLVEPAPKSVAQTYSVDMNDPDFKRLAENGVKPEILAQVDSFRAARNGSARVGLEE